jgi:hypothetical protein
MENNIQNLLAKVNLISKKYDDIAKITGEKFNIFRILKIESSEVKTHSTFIANLLNPKGSHDQGDVFLKLFYAELDKSKLLKINNFICNDANVKVEKHTEYGYIDIIVTDKKNNAIIIENKIYAEDQEKQLLRYHNYGNKYHKDSFVLLYLTLDGKDATQKSKGETIDGIEGLKENQFERISYSHFIKNWLEECKEKSVNHPILRETITQYINLIKYLTHQTINNKMGKEIINSMLQNVSASLEISNNINEMKKELLKIYVKKLRENFELTNPNDFKLDFNEESIGDDCILKFVNEKYLEYLIIRIIGLEVNCIGIKNPTANQENRPRYEKILSSLNIGKYESNWRNECVYISRYESLNSFLSSTESLQLIAKNEFEDIDEVIKTINIMLSAIVKVNENKSSSIA